MHHSLRCALSLLIGLAACGDDGGAVPLDGPPPPIDAPGLPSPCDTIAQNCGPGFRCTMVRAQRRCVEVAATPLALGAACTTMPPDFSDTCDVGLACYLGTCQRLCTAQMPSCPNGGSCFQYQTLQDGACQDPCTLFDSSTCGAGRTCEPGFRIGAQGPGLRCRPIGTKADGVDCTTDPEPCLENSVCGTIDAPICAPICDGSHTCAAGTCHIIPNSTYGVCS